MTVKIYSNTDVSAPPGNGVSGSLITLLDAVLVNGYGSKTAAGWTKVFAGTNIAVYRNNPLAPGSSGMYLRVDDTTSNYATVKAYKTMSDISTGTDMIPSGTPAYTNTAIYWIKSSSADTVYRPWMIVADDRTMYFNTAPNGTAPSTVSTGAIVMGAGDFDSMVPGNSWNYFIAGSMSSTWSSYTDSITYSSSNYAPGLIGRAQDLVANKQSKFYVQPINTWSGNGSQYVDSSYTNTKVYYPGLIIENATQANITGSLRGVYGLAGRCAYTTWMSNAGKLPDDPTGPDMIQFLEYDWNSNRIGAIFVRLGNW